jgi:hypothetical protein
MNSIATRIIDPCTIYDQCVACQCDGTTVLPRAWDHLVVSVSMVGLPVGVN